MNKNHWYDGWIYSIFIDPYGESLRNKIKELIKPESKVIDIGCGTGRLVNSLADKCEDVVGVELSEKMIEHAKNNKKDNTRFIHWDSTKLSDKIKEKFDYATICFALHEMNEEERIKTIKEMDKVAEELIIADFNPPVPIIMKIVEFFAGWKHFRNHQSFTKKGGLNSLMKKCGLRLKKEIKYEYSKIIII